MTSPTDRVTVLYLGHQLTITPDRVTVNVAGRTIRTTSVKKARLIVRGYRRACK